MKHEDIKTGSLATNRDLETWAMQLTDTPVHRRRLVQGVGVNDMAGSTRQVDGKQQNHPCYQSWSNLLERTYCPKFKERRSQRYADIADDWKTLSGFYAWWLQQPYYPGGNLDSDLLSAAHGLPKAYTPETACYVPARINTLLCANGKSRGELPQGVTRNGKGYIAKLDKGPEGKWHSRTTHDLAEAMDWYWKQKFYYALTTAYDLLEGNDQRDDLMVGVKETLRAQHDESLLHLHRLTQ